MQGTVLYLQRKTDSLGSLGSLVESLESLGLIGLMESLVLGVNYRQ
jgi:hypothetical protein